ncbi:CPCC family cysteine-rich protein [Gemmata algarum]|uniref:CPCC family cysteine-rich protein n=1 Tax=Gemmata algarum TaxID=2975278 RepID=UPI0039C8C865
MFGERMAPMNDEVPNNQSSEESAGREAWLKYRPRDLPLRCPCCGCQTLSERTAFEICEVCYWEDDGQGDSNADECRGGPNGSLSLREARANYLHFDACEKSMTEHVRCLRPEELPG